MYKVFIDHKPILVLNNANFSTKLKHVDAKQVIDFPKDIQLELDDVTIDSPLQIVCEDVESEFKRLFKPYELIQAAGGVVVSQDGVLVIERNGFWDIPKGKMEKGETPEESALREIEEECGINGHEIDKLLTITYHTYQYKGRDVLKKTYWYLLTYEGDDILTPQLNEGITKVEWFNQSRMPEIRSNTYGSIHDVLDAYDSL